ncbi:ABC transporter domain-containing protein [Ditylenchus destructor]|nr:ABC transporter domain-containing protein [Ditylenchus destructor]
MSAVQINDVVKRYGALEVVHGINLSIQPQEFVVLVGPSGCGKSTTLRMLAGLEDISDGTVSMDGRVVNKVAPKDRDIAMVFQNYALYPHLSVAENIAFGLRPLSNLDAKLRVDMRTEIKRLHQRMKTTMIYVTHDQVEAMTLADRIVIMNGGHIEQVGSPMEVFLEPANTFVASFIGSPPMNLLDGTIEKQDGTVKVRLTGGSGQRFSIPDAFAKNATGGQAVKLGLRPEIMSVEDSDGREVLHCSIDLVEPLGAEALLHGTADGQPFIAKAETLYGDHALNGVSRLSIDTARVHVFDAATGRSLKIRDGAQP